LCPAGISEDSTLFYSNQLKGPTGWDVEIRRARPEDGPSQLVGRVDRSSVPGDPNFFGPVLSPDGKWLGMPLLDGVTTNLFALPADGGAMRRLTDFGSRAVLITRRISWSPDSKYIYASVADVDSDVVLLDGLLR
jgi:Tol biopolymer transport system component